MLRTAVPDPDRLVLLEPQQRAPDSSFSIRSSRSFAADNGPGQRLRRADPFLKVILDDAVSVV